MGLQDFAGPARLAAGTAIIAYDDM